MTETCGIQEKDLSPLEIAILRFLHSVYPEGRSQEEILEHINATWTDEDELQQKAWKKAQKEKVEHG